MTRALPSATFALAALEAAQRRLSATTVARSWRLGTFDLETEGDTPERLAAQLAADRLLRSVRQHARVRVSLSPDGTWGVTAEALTSRGAPICNAAVAMARVLAEREPYQAFEPLLAECHPVQHAATAPPG